MIYTVNCIRFGYKLIDKETLMGTQTTYDILRKLKINMSFLKFLKSVNLLPLLTQAPQVE